MEYVKTIILSLIYVCCLPLFFVIFGILLKFANDIVTKILKKICNRYKCIKNMKEKTGFIIIGIFFICLFICTFFIDDWSREEGSSSPVIYFIRVIIFLGSLIMMSSWIDVKSGNNQRRFWY